MGEFERAVKGASQRKVRVWDHCRFVGELSRINKGWHKDLKVMAEFLVIEEYLM